MVLIDVPLIINQQRPSQGKIEILRNCMHMNKRIFCYKYSLEWKFQRGGASKAKVLSVRGMDIFENYVI